MVARQTFLLPLVPSRASESEEGQADSRKKKVFLSHGTEAHGEDSWSPWALTLPREGQCRMSSTHPRSTGGRGWLPSPQSRAWETGKENPAPLLEQAFAPVAPEGMRDGGEGSYLRQRMRSCSQTATGKNRPSRGTRASGWRPCQKPSRGVLHAQAGVSLFGL